MDSFAPGPGAYTVPSQIGAAAPAYSLSSRPSTALTSDSPGPGAHPLRKGSLLLFQIVC